MTRPPLVPAKWHRRLELALVLLALLLVASTAADVRNLASDARTPPVTLQPEASLDRGQAVVLDSFDISSTSVVRLSWWALYGPNEVREPPMERPSEDAELRALLDGPFTFFLIRHAEGVSESDVRDALHRDGPEFRSADVLHVQSPDRELVDDPRAQRFHYITQVDPYSISNRDSELGCASSRGCLDGLLFAWVAPLDAQAMLVATPQEREAARDQLEAAGRVGVRVYGAASLEPEWLLTPAVAAGMLAPLALVWLVTRPREGALPSDPDPALARIYAQVVLYVGLLLALVGPLAFAPISRDLGLIDAALAWRTPAWASRTVAVLLFAYSVGVAVWARHAVRAWRFARHGRQGGLPTVAPTHDAEDSGDAGARVDAR